MSPNSKEEEYVDLYSDLFNEDEVHRSGKCITSTTTNNNNNNNNNNKSSLDDEVLFFGHLGSLETEVKELRTVRQTLTTENEQLKATLATKERTIAVLRNNISSLYKTAKLELERRSAELAEVRREYDTLIFRRRTSQAAGVGAGDAGVQAPVPPPPPPVESPVIGTEQSTARSADRHSSHNSPLGSSSFSRYSPYSTPRQSENASSNRKEAVRPATEPIHRAQSRYSSSSSSRHSSSTPIRHHHSHHHHSHHHHHHQHRNRLFD